MKKYKKMILMALKLLVTGASVYWLLTLTDLRVAWQSITAVPVLIIFLAVCIMLAGFVVGSFRWWLLLRHAASTIRYRKILPSYYLGIFFNNILPTTMGGDVIRTLHLSLRGISPKALIGSTIIDRVIGLFTILALGFVCIGLSSEIIVRKSDRLVLMGVGALVATAIAVLFNARFLGLIQRLAAAYQHTRIRKFLLETIQLCHSYKSAHAQLLAAAGLTVLMQSAVIFSYYMLGKAVGITLPLFTYFGIIPLVFLAGAIPISLGGIGVREGALVGLLIAIGVNTHLAVALSFLFLFVLLVASLPGSLVMLFGRTDRNSPP